MKKSASKKDSLVGAWRSTDELGYDVVYRITRRKSGYAVVACDTTDGECADIFEERWDPAAGIFSFAAYWNSTGRFTRCRLLRTSRDQVSLTYTYTATETLVRTDEK